MAAPTTSLPEDIGGVRNWDYRYCWLRTRCSRWCRWPGRLHRRGDGLPRLRLPGRDERPGQPADHVRARRRAAPDRVRAAAPSRLRGLEPGAGGQRGVGAVPARRLRRGDRGRLHRQRAPGRGLDARFAPRWRALVEQLEKVWREPDDGIWEARGPRRHFTHSKVMAWVAFDRAVRLVERMAPTPSSSAGRGSATRSTPRSASRAGTPARTFTQYYGSEELDASRADDPDRRVPAGGRRARHRHHRRRPARASGTTGSWRATRPPRPTTAWRGPRASSWPARSGW